MATTKQLIEALKLRYPEYWAWLQNKENALQKVRNLAGSLSGSGEAKFFKAIEGLKSYGTFTAGQTEDDPFPEGDEGVLPDDFPDEAAPTAPAESTIDEDVRDLLSNFLVDNELPTSLMGFITNALGQKWSYARIVAELRQTSEYKQAYPEMALRQQFGWDRMTEAEIRASRSEMRRLAFEYLGISDISNEDLAQVIGAKNKSLREYEHDLQTYRELERWGPAVKQVLASELGYLPDDELVFRFLHADINTPELDRAYARSLRRGQPASLGLGIRPEEEATILEQFGISPEQAFKGYQGIVSEIPRAERFAAIEREIARNAARFPSPAQILGDTTFAQLFRAVQLGDPEALANLQGSLAREVARFQAGGGVAQSSTGAAVGLLTPEERNRRT